MNQVDELDILASAMKDKRFLARFASRVRGSDFSNEVYGVVWDTIAGLWTEYHEMPTFNAVDRMITAKIESDFFYKEDVPWIVQAMKALKDRPVMAGLTYALVEEWMADRARAQFAQDAQRSVLEGDPAMLERAYSEYSSKLAHTEDERDFFDRWTEIAQNAERLQDGFITTGHGMLDNIIGGGYLKGDFFMLWGVDGLGKSWLAIQLGMKAVTQGRRVLHVTNEMLKISVEERYLALFSQVNTKNFSKNVSHIQSLQERHQNMKGLLRVQFLPLGSTVADIRGILEEAVLDERPYDLVIIDYVDKLEPARRMGGDDWLRLEHLFEELAQLSKLDPNNYRNNPAICAVTHANAEADGKAIPKGRKAIGRSQMGKSKAVDFSLVLGQDSTLAEQDVIQVTRVKDPRDRSVDAKKNTCLLKHLKTTGAFVAIGFDEVSRNEE